MSYSSPSTKKSDPAAKQMEQQMKLLESILKRPGNDNCADCGQKGPRWASINLGIFVCIRCSGIHRNMGTHISKVKSVSLDKWAPEMIRTVDVIGNLNAKRIYEGKCPSSYPRPRESDTYGVEQWIRDKYDRKKFYDAAAAAEIFSGISTNSPQPKQSSPAVDEEQARKLRREQRRKQREQESADRTRAVPVQQSIQQAPAPTPSVDLLFGDLSTPSQPVQQQQFQPVPQQQFQQVPQQQFQQAPPQQQQQQFTSSADAFFSEFQSSSPSVQPTHQNSQAAFFQEPVKQEPPKASKEQILSLFKADQNSSNPNNNGLYGLSGFGTTPVPPQTQNAPNYSAFNTMGGYNMNTTGMGMNNMSGYGMNTMGMNNMGGYSMNTMGMNNMGMNTMNQGGINNLSGFNTFGGAGNMNAVRPNQTTGNTWGAQTNVGFVPSTPQNNFSNLNW